MTCHLGALARHTGGSPGPDISPKARPDELGSHQLCRGLDAWVGKAVDDVKNAAPPACGHQGAWLAGGDVAEQCSVGRAKHHILQLQRSGGCSAVLNVGVCDLVLCQSCIVEAQVDRPHDRPGEAVGNEIVLAATCWMSVVYSEMAES